MKRVIRVFALLAIVAVAFVACAGAGDDDPFGTWAVPTITPLAGGGDTITGSVLTLQTGGTYALTYTYVPGGAGSHSGTFTPASLPESTIITFTVLARSGVAPGLNSTWTLKYSNLTSNTAVFYIDTDGGGFAGPYTAIRQ